MSETSPNTVDLQNQIIQENNLREVMEASPEHPFTTVVKTIQEKGKDIYTNTIHYGLQAGVIAKTMLTLGAVVDIKACEPILKAFEPLQHVTNMGASYAIIGASVAATEFSEGALEAANHPKAAKIISKALPVIGAISAVGIQLFIESRKIVPWDKLDQNDTLYGIAIIAPGYFAARHFLSKNFQLREKGIALFGRLKKKVERPSEIISPNDLAVLEVKEISDSLN